MHHHRFILIVLGLFLDVSMSWAVVTSDTIRELRRLTAQRQEAMTYSNSPVACPEIILPSITGSKSSFRYIDADCQSSLTIKPFFGVSGGTITDYDVYSIPYAPPFGFNEGTKIFIDQDDVWGDIIKLPFKFCFFNNIYDKAVVAANGILSFNTSVAGMQSGWSLETHSNIPSKDFVGSGGSNWANAIYGVFEDIDPRKITTSYTNGSIRYGVLGSYPCRTLTISWNKVPNYSCVDSRYWETYQIVVYEGTNVIDVYVNHRARCSSWNYGRGIIGIQNATGTKGIAAPGRNTTDMWAAEKEAWRFSPISQPNYTITYYEGKGINGRVLGTGDQITINPQEISAITARLQFVAGNGDSFDLRDTAVIVSTRPQPEITNKTICEGQSYAWYGKNYTKPGTYTHEIGGNSGCAEKLYQLNLSIAGGVHPVEYKTICKGEQFSWHGKIYTETGIYYDQQETIDGCEDLYTLDLTVNPSFQSVTDAFICAGQGYSWRGKQYSKGGNYRDAYQTKLGCDSVYLLQLTDGATYFFPAEVELCEGEFYQWRGNSYSQSGVYYDSLVASCGCDSIYQLIIRTYPKYEHTESAIICEGEVYLWHGETLSKSGTYYHHYQSVYGCDSVYILNLTVAPTYHFITEGSVRSGQSYTWRGNQYSKSGIYYDKLVSSLGCDSIYQLNLQVYKAYFYPKQATICEGESYTYRGKTFTTDTIYGDTLISRFGTDSIYQLILTVQKPYHPIEEVSICQGEEYQWHGSTYTTTGIYLDEHKSLYRCDSTYELQLIVNPTYHYITEGVLCQNSFYEWRGFKYTKPGIYFDNNKTQTGCDSIYELRLRLCQTYYFEHKDTICAGESCIWRNKKYSEQGIYYDSLLTSSGCDSVYALILTVGGGALFQQTDSFCEGDTYYWRGKSFKQPGIYYDSCLTALGCDSVYQLTLRQTPIYKFTTIADICEGETYFWRDANYSKTDVYQERYVSSIGCDSIYELILTVHPKFLYQAVGAICDGDTYYWHGKEYSKPGIYYDSLKTITGCDSIWQLTIREAHKYFYSEDYELCDGVSYTWHGKTYTKEGVYYDSLTTVYGCDSVYQLNLTVLPSYWFSDSIAICEGDSFPWRDSVYAISGTYYDWLVTELGCDSVYTLHLMVYPNYSIQDTIFLCEGDSCLWHNHIYRESGLYYDSLSSQTLCDSVHSLLLNVTPRYLFSQEDTICDGEVYSWRGRSYSSTGIYYDSLKTIAGCDSIYRLDLYFRDSPVPSLPISDICADDTAFYIYCNTNSSNQVFYEIHFDDLALRNGLRDTAGFLQEGAIRVPLPFYPSSSYIMPNHYLGQLILRSEVCTTDHIYDFYADILYPASVVVQKFEDVLAVQNERYNGGYTFSSFQWYANGEKLEGQNKSYYYNPPKLDALYYQVLLTRVSDGITMLSCPIYPSFDKQPTQQSMRLFPTMISYNNPQTQLDGVLPPWGANLFDINGQLTKKYNGTQSDGNILPLPHQRGLFILQVINHDGKVQSAKVLIY